MSPTQDLAALYRSLGRPLEEIVRIDVRHARDEVVEEACQFAWDRLVHHRARVKPETALPWLARTAVHEAFRLLSRERRCVSLDETLVGDAFGSQGPNELFERRERLRTVGDLPARQQRLLWLHALGLSYAEIALEDGSTARAVERQLQRARRRLRAAAA